MHYNNVVIVKSYSSLRLHSSYHIQFKRMRICFYNSVENVLCTVLKREKKPQIYHNIKRSYSPYHKAAAAAAASISLLLLSSACA